MKSLHYLTAKVTQILFGEFIDLGEENIVPKESTSGLLHLQVMGGKYTNYNLSH